MSWAKTQAIFHGAVNLPFPHILKFPLSYVEVQYSMHDIDRSAVNCDGCSWERKEECDARGPRMAGLKKTRNVGVIPACP